MGFYCMVNSKSILRLCATLLVFSCTLICTENAHAAASCAREFYECRQAALGFYYDEIAECENIDDIEGFLNCILDVQDEYQSKLDMCREDFDWCLFQWGGPPLVSDWHADSKSGTFREVQP